MKNLKLVGKILEVFLKIFICISVVFLILLYSIVNKLGLHFDWFVGMIYPCGILFLCIVYQFVNLFKTLSDNTPFCNENVIRLRKGMIFSFIISILILIALLLAIFAYSYYSLQLKVALAFMSFLFFGVSVALYILSVLFKVATKYKEENDLTI